MKARDYSNRLVQQITFISAMGVLLLLNSATCLGAFQVFRPNGGQVWLVGEEEQISWSGGSWGTPVRIYVSYDGGLTWPRMMTVSNYGAYNWTVQGPASTQCRVAVGTNLGDADISDANFTIQQVTLPSVSMVSVDPSARSATFHGRLDDDGGEACQVKFVYQLLRFPPPSEDETNPQSGKTSPTPFEDDVGGLVPDATYLVWAEAENSAGTAKSESLVFGTLAEVLVPDLVGKTRAEAEAALAGRGLVLGDVTIVSSPLPENTVLAQDPEPGTTVIEGSAVAVTLSEGPVVVPDLTGMTEAEADAVLAAAGLEVAGRWWTASEEPAGTVIDQDPAAGTLVARGTQVDLTLSQGPSRHYVDIRAHGNNSGLSWTNAFVHLQDALAAAESGDQIWVAQGIYKPDQGRHVTAGDPEATFALVSGVELYGGFPPRGGDWQQRDPVRYDTTLSGDIGVPDDPSDNCYHVVVASNTNANTVLDGFTITGGNANGQSGDYYIYAGGVYNLRGHLSVANCLFTGNAGVRSGAVFIRWSDATFYNCRFVGNTAELDGGGMTIRESSPILANCEFLDNVAGRNGGAILAFLGGHPWLINCLFAGNSAAGSSGAVFNHSGGCSFAGCVFTGNTAKGAGGALYNLDNDEPVYSINCTFSGNSSTSNNGGAVFDKNGSHTMVNCILWGNSASSGSQLAAYGASDVEVHHCCVEGGQGQIVLVDSSFLDWGVGNLMTDPLLVDADGLDGIPGTEDDCLDLQAGSPCIDAGDSTQVPQDIADVDGDADTRERLPWDAAGNTRFGNDPATADTGIADPPDYPQVVDIGAYEYTSATR